MLNFTTCYQISVKQKMIYVKKNIISRLDYSVCRKGPSRWSLMQFRVGPQLNFYKSLILAYIWSKLPMHLPGSTAASGLGSAQFPGQTQPSQASPSSQLWSELQNPHGPHQPQSGFPWNENVTPALSALPVHSLYLWTSLLFPFKCLYSFDYSQYIQVNQRHRSAN